MSNGVDKTETFEKSFSKEKSKKNGVPPIIIKPSSGWVSLKLKELGEYR